MTFQDSLVFTSESDSSQLQKVWESCLLKIRGEITSLSFKTWFQPIVPLKLQGEDLTIRVPSQFFYDWLEGHYSALLRTTIAEVLGEKAKLFYSVASDDVREAVVESASAAYLARGLYYVLPNFAAFDIKAQVVHALPVEAPYVATTAVYGAVYIAFLLTGAVAVFSRRDFK